MLLIKRKQQFQDVMKKIITRFEPRVNTPLSVSWQSLEAMKEDLWRSGVEINEVLDMTGEFDTSEVYNGNKTWAEYYAQFPSVIPELGKKYVQHPNDWQQMIWEIIFVDDKIAVGRAINPFDTQVTEHSLFTVKGPRAGWRSCDSRSSYRLQPLEKIKA